MKKVINSLHFLILQLILSLPLSFSFYNEKTNMQIITGNASINDLINKVDDQIVFHHHKNLMSYGIRHTGTDNAVKGSNYNYEAFDRYLAYR